MSARHSLCMEQMWQRSARISGRETVHLVRGRREPVEEPRLNARTITSMCDRACAKARRAISCCLGGSRLDTSLFHRSLARPAMALSSLPALRKLLTRDCHHPRVVYARFTLR